MSRKTTQTPGRYVVKSPFARLRKVEHGNRVQCIGDGCEVMVLKGQGECRDCRRARVRAGKKRIAKTLKGNSLYAKIVRLLESAKKQYHRVKNIRWNRPKNWQTVQKLHIPQRRQPRDPMVAYFEQRMKEK